MQETQNPSKINMEKATLGHIIIIIKLLKTKDKEKILKLSEEKILLTSFQQFCKPEDNRHLDSAREKHQPKIFIQ